MTASRKISPIDALKREKILEHVANGMAASRTAELYGFTDANDIYRVNNWVRLAGGAEYLRQKAQNTKLRKDSAS